MGLQPNYEPMTIKELIRHDRCRPFIHGRILSIQGLLEHTLKSWSSNGRLFKWIESECKFNAWHCWSTKLSTDVMLLFGHSPFQDNADFGGCNQYFWISVDAFRSIFREI
jgi:hypothetical protein